MILHAYKSKFLTVHTFELQTLALQTIVHQVQLVHV